ncbi:MAG: DUF4038 domain-containing protein, partial [Opitutaceae bacterium]|nr:DUF4038 domain-containing protein [Opitutaceae bacterium]
TDNVGLNGVTGEIDVTPYTGANPLLRHGPLRVAPSRGYLEHLDGTPFFWLGDTWWMGLCHRLRFPEDFATLAADRREKGFNVIQIVAGLYPDMPPFDPRGANEAGFPWEREYARIRPEYFDAADKRIEYLVDQGFAPCIVGAWGYFMPWMGVEKLTRHWRYLIARYGALPVVWCIAGETNLPWYLAPNFPSDDRSQVREWTKVARAVREMDPFHRILTLHPTGIGRLSARNATDDVSLLDFDMLQTPHGQRGAVAPTVNTVRQSYADTPILPVINGEPAYEMLSDTLPTEWSRQMFWLCMMNGAAGHTYGANGIWQVNRKGKPHGPSPNQPAGSTGYGVIAWDEAMRLPGSSQMSYGRRLFERYRWQDFQPHPEWAEFADRSPFDFGHAAWIWSRHRAPGADAPPSKRWFRRTFDLPDGRPVKLAQLYIAASGPFAARINKRSGGSGAGAALCSTFYNLAHLLQSGRNVLAVSAEIPPAAAGNIVGLIARLDITFADGSTLQVSSDDSWVSHAEEAREWDTATFDERSWTRAGIVAAYGDAPWGRIARPNSSDVFGPQSTGLQDGVRLTYVPSRSPVRLKGLPGGSGFRAAYFDPVTGRDQTLGELRADGAGTALVPPLPNGGGEDWVLVWELKHQR